MKHSSQRSLERRVLFVVLVSIFTLQRPSPAQELKTPAKLEPRRIAIASPEPLPMTGTERDMAISPDGTHVVYVSGAAGGGKLMVRPIDQGEAVPLVGTDGAHGPFIASDGRWVGFFTASELKKVPIAGGASVSLCAISGHTRGASWGPDNTIVFATGANVGLRAVSAAGGEPKVLTTPDTALGEVNHVLPSVLPGGRSVLFTITSNRSTGDVAILDLKTGQRKTLVKGGMQAEYLETGHLVYATGSALSAVRFDTERLEVLGESVRVIGPVFMRNNLLGAAEYAVSRHGTLVYAPGGQAAATKSLVWVNRQGQEEPINTAPMRAYLAARISPDGARVALDIRDQPYGIWMLDLVRQTMTRLTDVATIHLSVWTPDSRRIIFSAGPGAANPFSQPVDNTAGAERLTISSNFQVPTSISPDGTRLIVAENTPTGREVRVLRLEGGSRQTEPLMQTSLNGTNGELSPDGRWLAYQSDESGQNQIYVRPFPNAGSGRWQISTSGGTRPAWARNGRELFYLDSASAMTVVPVQVTPTFKAGSPTKLFDRGDFDVTAGVRAYDVSPDGQRVLVFKGQTSMPNMVVIRNWMEELKTCVRVK